MYNSNYSTIKLQLCDISDRVPTEPLEEYLWSDMAGFQPPTNSLHGLPVASCHKNNNSGQSFDTGVCRKSGGAYCDNILLFFTLNHAFHSIFINTNLVRYVNYNKIVSYRVDIYQPRISILPPVKHQNGLHVEGFERIRSH